MYTFSVKNKYGDTMEITNNDRYVIEDITGIDPPDSTINTTRNANADGSVYNSSYMNNRQIIITLAINTPAEDNRLLLYKYFKSKYGIRLYYTNDTRDVYIDGFVQKINVSFFNKKQIAQITVVCPDPMFNARADEIVDFSSTQDLFKFPFTINTPIPFGAIEVEQEVNIRNTGDVESGFIFNIHAIGAMSTPKLVNADTLEFFQVNKELAAGDEIIINTKKKQKSVTLISSGVETSLIGYIESGSTWLSLDPGDNTFIVTATSNPENMMCYATLTEQYEGV